MSPSTAAVLGALLPCLAWLVFFYRRDRLQPEPVGLILWLFLIGALGVTLIAGILNTAAFLALTGGDLQGPTAAAAFGLLAVVVAPVVEEPLKYLGTSIGARRRRAFDEPVDGMVYGSTVGLGFAAAETVDYLAGAIEGVGPLGAALSFCSPGVECFVQTAFLRGIGSALLHATASGIAGYGLSRRVIGGRPRATALWWIAVAVVSHAAWNAVAFPALVLPVAVYAVLLRRARRRSPFRVS